ncbi:MAG: hypothetical protein QOE14_2153 [Humisphaera sp.]|nr:hypothetical protein [Humisphaera sp.]
MSSDGVVTRAARRAGWALSSLRDWNEYRRTRADFRAKTRGAVMRQIEAPVGHRTRHTYTIADGKVLTTFQMDQRWRIVERLYPQKVTSLLDIGCCRGWFVIQAALRNECERATGVDVVQGFIDAANEAKAALKLDKTQFEYAFLDDIAGDPQRFRTPYQTILLLNTYHYMFWGSEYSPKHWADHDYLWRTLAGMCTDRVIFMSPLEVSECPADIAERARQHPDWAAQYTTEKFNEVAGKYFDVTLESYMGLRPLYLMRKK